jgi:hypothetical protein
VVRRATCSAHATALAMTIGAARAVHGHVRCRETKTARQRFEESRASSNGSSLTLGVSRDVVGTAAIFCARSTRNGETGEVSQLRGTKHLRLGRRFRPKRRRIQNPVPHERAPHALGSVGTLALWAWKIRPSAAAKKTANQPGNSPPIITLARKFAIANIGTRVAERFQCWVRHLIEKENRNGRTYDPPSSLEPSAEPMGALYNAAR